MLLPRHPCTHPSAFGFAGASCPRVLGGSDRTWFQNPVHIHAPRAACSTMARTCSQRDLMLQLPMVPCMVVGSWLHGPHTPHCHRVHPMELSDPELLRATRLPAQTSDMDKSRLTPGSPTPGTTP